MAIAIISMYLVALVLTLAWATKGSGAAVGASTHSRMAVTASGAARTAESSEAVRPCPDARRAITFYHRWYHRHRAAMKRPMKHAPHERVASCDRVRQLAARWRDRARQAREQLRAWWRYHWDWRNWLPDKWQRIAYCETHKGRYIPGDWRHNSGTYQGAFGFAVRSWDDFVPRADPKAAPYPSEAYLATPRQQYEVALAIWRMFGFSGWGCRNA